MSLFQNQSIFLEVIVMRSGALKNFGLMQEFHLYVEYGSIKLHTRACAGGQESRIYRDKFTFPLVEEQTEFSISIYTSNAICIGKRSIQLQEVVSKGFEEICWSIYDESNIDLGEVRLTMKYSTDDAIQVEYYPKPLATSVIGLKRPVSVSCLDERTTNPTKRKMTLGEPESDLQKPPQSMMDMEMDDESLDRMWLTSDHDTIMVDDNNMGSLTHHGLWHTICF